MSVSSTAASAESAASGPGSPDSPKLVEPHRGFLLKRGHVVPNWKKRYFTLVHNRLIYFDNIGGKRKGDFVLTRTTLVKESNAKPYGFVVHDAEDPKRFLYMAASTNSERSGWMREILGHVNTLIVAYNDKTMSIRTSRAQISSLSRDRAEVDNLEVTVVKGRNIYPLKSHVLQNPYVLVKVCSDEYRTKAAPTNWDPEWNEMLRIPFDRSIRYISFEVWYVDGVSGKDTFLASFPINIFSIGPGKSVQGWHSLGRHVLNQSIEGDLFISVKTNLSYEVYSKKLFNSILVLPELSFLAWMNLSAVSSRQLESIIKFPGEDLYDVALGVALSASITGFSFSSQGMLVLTNYRLIFVSLNRLRDISSNVDVNSPEVKDLTVNVVIPTITSVTLKVVKDPKTSISSDCLSIRTNDCKSFSLTFGDSSTYRGGRGFNFSGAEGSESESSKKSNKPGSNNRSRQSKFVDEELYAYEEVVLPLVNGPASNDLARTTETSEDVSSMQLPEFSDMIEAIQASNSRDGPSSRRICKHLQFRLLNRHLEIEQARGFFNAHVQSTARAEEAAVTAPRMSVFTGMTELSALITGKPAPSDHARRSSVTAGVPIVNGGWVTFRTSVEYNRMGIPDPYWRITTENNDYSLCPTYPPALVLPTSIDDSTIREAALFRSKSRFPVLSWRDPKNRASLCRSSQPMVGITQKRSTMDELLIEKINMAGIDAYRAELDKTIVDPWSTDFNKPFVFMDARPKINAQANQAAGKGYENPEFYSNSRIRFLDIPNIHAVRSSLEGLEELCVGQFTSDTGFLKNVEATKWLTHIRMILTGAMRIAHCIHRERLSVLVHCSDGWDRTAQLCSLAKLMLDPHYRTLRGFMALIEQEWFSFGHKFADRLGFSSHGWFHEERSPVFQQFMDCLYQWMQQSPTIFEFNEDLLIYIIRALNSGLFGNSYANCYSEQMSLWNSTLSIWSVVLTCPEPFHNLSYRPVSVICTPIVSAKCFNVWNHWYLNWHNALFRLQWEAIIDDVALDEDLVSPDSKIDSTASGSSSCWDCKKPFTLYRRRHKCRECWREFCHVCSNYRRIVPSVSLTVLSRCCKECSVKLDSDSTPGDSFVPMVGYSYEEGNEAEDSDSVQGDSDQELEGDGDVRPTAAP